MQEEAGLAHWRFTCRLEGEVPISQQAGLVAGIGMALFRLLLDKTWSPNAVYFSHAPPQDIRPYKRRFECPVFFNWDASYTTFDAAILDSPINEANPQLHRVLQEHLVTVRQSFGDDYCGQIRYLIHQAMTTGDCSIERVANSLAINKRTLQRQLKSHNTSYKDLLEDTGAPFKWHQGDVFVSEDNGITKVRWAIRFQSHIPWTGNIFAFFLKIQLESRQ